MKVFIGGPREITALNADIEERLDNIIAQGYDVLVGDANGIDASVQRFFCGKDYGRVRIYCMNDTCRNNIGGWPVKSISNRYTAWDIAGLDYNKGTTFYFFPRGRIEHGGEISDWDGVFRPLIST